MFHIIRVDGKNRKEVYSNESLQKTVDALKKFRKEAPGHDFEINDTPDRIEIKMEGQDHE